MPDTQETRPHAVVVNDEEQYSIWPAERDLPAGWRRDGFSGTPDECLAYIDETWTDMRPLSLRRWMNDRGMNDRGMNDRGMRDDQQQPGTG